MASEKDRSRSRWIVDTAQEPSQADPKSGSRPTPPPVVVPSLVNPTTANPETSSEQTVSSTSGEHVAHESAPRTLAVHRISSKEPTQVSGETRRESATMAKRRQQVQRTNRNQGRPDPILQSLMLLVTMGCMLAAARFVVPSIVEEVRYSWHRGELRAEYETGHQGLKNVSLDALSDAYQMVTSAVGPSVVHIEVKRRASEGDELARFLSAQSVPAADQGSGVVVDDAGFIVTNRHVIADGRDITVTLSDGREVDASIVGSDALTDLAVLKIDADGLMPIKWGDSETCRVGSPVWAVGSPFGFDRSVTFGILSGKHRMVRASTRYQDFMQSDVAVNPGNSGGPLVNARGELIGINTAIVGDTYQGVSFSIPSSVAKKIYKQICASGQVERGWLGVSLQEVPDDQLLENNHRIRGAMVGGLTSDDSPAAVAGVKAGDIITRVDDERIRDMGHLMRVVGNAIAGTSVELTLMRDGKQLAVTVRLNKRPSELNVQ